MEWISVDDRLPGVHCFCIATFKNYSEKITVHYAQYNAYTKLFSREKGSFWNDDYPATHWMPLPEPPKEGE